MFKKLLILSVLGATLALGACSGVPVVVAPGGTTTPPTSVTGDPTTDAILAATVKACGFLPTVSTVTGIIASFVPGGAPVNSLVTSIASSICNAVAPKASAMRRGAVLTPPIVNGVIIEGRFIN